MQKVSGRYLFTFPRKAKKKVFHKKGDNFVIGCGSGHGPQDRKALSVQYHVQYISLIYCDLKKKDGTSKKWRKRKIKLKMVSPLERGRP